MKIRINILLLMTSVGLSACAHKVASYPQNDAAIKRQIIDFQYMPSDIGDSSVTVVMSDGETLKGQYTTASSGISQTTLQASSNTYATAIGSGGYAMGQGHTTGNGTLSTIAPSGNGMANLLGNNGTIMRCIYATNNFTGKGTGTCETNKGEVYGIHF